MSNHLHILGRFRWPIVFAITAVISFFAHNYLSTHVYTGDIRNGAIWLRIGITCLGSFIFAFLFTTEFIFRVIIAFVPALIIGGLVGLLTYFGIDAFTKGQTKVEDLQMWGYIVGGLSGLVAWVAFYQRLDNSSWIGSRCPSCLVRGKLSSSQIGKDYIGDTYERSGNETRRYNKYRITTLHECSSCGHSWQTTAETKERA